MSLSLCLHGVERSGRGGKMAVGSLGGFEVEAERGGLGREGVEFHLLALVFLER